MEGAKKALTETKKKLELLLKQESKFLEETAVKQANRQKKREWYEKFHWFFSSEGFLCVGGKDATSNEVIIKKHLEKNDLVLHTDMAGSPFLSSRTGRKPENRPSKKLRRRWLYIRALGNYGTLLRTYFMSSQNR